MASDEMSRKGGKRFAWRTTEPPDEPEDDAEQPAPAAADRRPISTEQARAQLREALEKQCAVLADEVDRVWDLQDPDAQRSATIELLANAAALGLAPAAMDSFPRACLRLIRLILRHYRSLPEESRDNATSIFLWLPMLELDETGDLLVQMARAGMRDLLGGFWIEARKRELKSAVLLPVHVEQLGAIVDGGPSWNHRMAALELLAVMPRVSKGPAIPALRRALRLPHIEARKLALEMLLACSPPRLLPEDVLFLLRDGFDHPFEYVRGRSLNDAAAAYASDLHDAVAQIHPVGGATILLELIDAGLPWGWKRVVHQHPFALLQPGWALDALAAGYPDRAVQTIAPLLRSPWTETRATATEALRHLPQDLCEPRLRQAAADTAPSVARAARALWIERMGTPCPVEIAAGLPLDLLDHPPDEELLTRAQLLHGRSGKASAAMVQALLDEAPRREALVLLVAMLSDEPFWTQQLRAGLPKSVGEACQTLVERFGTAGIEGLCWLARRYPGGNSFQSWLQRLKDLGKKDLLPAEASPMIRALAEARVRSGDEEELSAALSLLLRTGVSADLHPRIVRLATTRSDDEWLQGTAAKLLVACEAPALDALVIEHLGRAVDASDSDSFVALSRAALDREMPEALALAERVIAGLDAQSNLSIARECARALHARGRLPEGWVREGLAHPGEPRFHVAVWLVLGRAAGEIEHDLLRSALRSPLPAVVEDALYTLLFERLIRATDPEVLLAMRRLPLPARARVSGGLLFAHEMSDEVLDMVSEAFTLPGGEELDDLCERLFMWKTKAQKAGLNRVLSQVQDASAREQIERHLWDLVGSVGYWQHKEEEEDEEGESGSAEEPS